MPGLLDRLHERHRVRPNISGKGDPPEFDTTAGAWVTASKAQHALLLLEHSLEGHFTCHVPPLPRDRFRLGQINFTSLYPDAVVAFRLWCAAKAHHDERWTFLPRVSWHLAFRLRSPDVEHIRRTFEGHSQSGIEFRFTPEDGALAAYTQRRIVPCGYLHGGLILNHGEDEEIGFRDYQYRDATEAIRDFIRVSPLPPLSAESP